MKQNFLQNVRATLEHYLQVYDEKEKELSSKPSLKPDGNVALHSTSFEPVVRIELSEGTDHNLSVDEELQVGINDRWFWMNCYLALLPTNSCTEVTSF